MRFRILGPLEAYGSGGERVPLRAAKQRTVLTVLLLHANSRVSVDRLTTALWPDRPPRSAGGNVRTYVSALRQMLRLDSEEGHLPRLGFERGGYRLDLAPSELDMLVFEELEQRARRVLNDGDSAAAATLLWDALGLWRGSPAEDITVDGETAATLDGLKERRLLAEEAWVDARLTQGHDADLVVRLRALVAAHPLREQRWHRLMVALYRTGRQAEALAAFQELRSRVVHEMGIEPSPEMQCLQRQILAGEALDFGPAAVAVSRAVIPPRQLPPDIVDFTGRTVELGRLTALVGSSDMDRPATVAIVAISGTAGAGKTALAVHWAHQVADRFGDGQLYVNLRGHAAARPVEPHEALARFLRALGIERDAVPRELDEAAALYRSLLAGKQTLVVLDNAANSGQVRPLLPGTPGCLVLVTSRNRLPGLRARDGAARITLEPLPEADAVALLRETLGRERVDAELAATARIAARCAYLPLALRIAAERAANRPQLTLADLASQLAATRHRLNMLAAGDDTTTEIRAVFSWSYQALPADTARMFRLLGLHTGPDISVHAAAALAAAGEDEARRWLDVLAGVHLLDEAAPDRYQFHDLLRTYAAELASSEESSQAQAEAIRRELTWYLHSADAANRALGARRRRVELDPAPANVQPLAFAGYEQALAWCDTEHTNLVAAIAQAAATGHDELAWQLPSVMWDFFDLRKPWSDSIGCHSIGLASARRAGDLTGQAWSLNGLGAAHFDQRQFGDALGCHLAALSLVRVTGDRKGEGAVLNNLAITYWELNRLDDALDCFRQSLDIAREIGDRHGECIATDNLGEAYQRAGRTQQAIPWHRRGLAIARETGDLLGEGMALNELGAAYRALGQAATAVDCYQQALAIRRRADDRYGEAGTLRDLGNLFTETGRVAAARECWQKARAILTELGDPRAAQLAESLPPTAE